MSNPSLHTVINHLFRHEAGKMVSVLVRIFGFRNRELAEDIVQETLLKALETWKFNKIPDNPSAWLHTVARNKAMDVIRREKNFKKISAEFTYLLQSDWVLSQTISQLFAEAQIKDSQLRMIFTCCHPALPEEAQVTLVLKILCGLNVQEIANAFLTSRDTIEKRLYRAKNTIRTANINLEMPAHINLHERMDAVLHVLYLLFNEGYHSSHPDHLIRKDLCEEAMRLCVLLTDIPATNVPAVQALLALMCFQASRFDARISEAGMQTLLPEQDRSKWNYSLIAVAADYLNKAAHGDKITKYHIEAAIAGTYAKAPGFADTDWQQLLDLYNLLTHYNNSPVVYLNRAVVLAKVAGYHEALTALVSIKGLSNHYLYHSIMGEFYLHISDPARARHCFETALSLTRSAAEINLLHEKITAC